MLRSADWSRRLGWRGCTTRGWWPGSRSSLLIAAAAVAVLPLVVVLLHDRPADPGLTPYGGDRLVAPPRPVRGNAAGLALAALRQAASTKPFWALAGAFAICGATTNGLIGIHGSFGTCTYAWFGGAALCALAAVLSIGLRRHRDIRRANADTGTRDTDIEAETSPA
jgi:hypothetical protein